MPVKPLKWSSVWSAYINHMSQKDLFDFAFGLVTTIVAGTLLMYLAWYLYSRLQAKPKLSIPRRMPPAPHASPDKTQKTPVALESASSIPKEHPSEEGKKLPTELIESHVVRRIPRGAQAALVDRGQRLVNETKFQEALVCFLSLLYSASNPEASKEERVLPTHLTECLRGAAQCFRGLGQGEIAVKFLQAERRVFEEMVVQAANPEGRRPALAPESVLGPLLGRAGEELPKRCFTLDEVSEACSKLGYHDVALAYKVKSAALRSKISGKPLDPESEEAAQLARAISEFKTRHGDDAAAAGGCEAAPPAASSGPPSGPADDEALTAASD